MDTDPQAAGEPAATSAAYGEVEPPQKMETDAHVNGLLNGVDDDDEEDQFYVLVMERILELEKRKERIDAEERQLREVLKEKHGIEEASKKAASDHLLVKETLRDELVRLKVREGRLIEESECLMAVDREMRAFADMNARFNENLRRHLNALNEKQADIYTIKPTIQGQDVEVQNNLAREDFRPMNEAIIAAVHKNMDRVRSDIAKTCEEFFIKRNEEVDNLNRREQDAKANIRELKAKLKELRKAKNKPPAWKQPEEPKRSRSKRSLDEDDADSVYSTASRRKSGRAEPRSWHCEGCYERFDNHDRFADHIFRACEEIDRVLTDKEVEEDDKLLDCPYCSQSFNSYTSISAHKISAHGPNAASGQPLEGATSTGKRGGGKRAKR